MTNRPASPLHKGNQRKNKMYNNHPYPPFPPPPTSLAPSPPSLLRLSLPPSPSLPSLPLVTQQIKFIVLSSLSKALVYLMQAVMLRPWSASFITKKKSYTPVIDAIIAHCKTVTWYMSWMLTPTPTQTHLDRLLAYR